jgi:hypothetical protein
MEYYVDSNDSLAVAVVRAGEEPLLGRPFAVETVAPVEMTGWYTPVRESDGCCEDDPVAVRRVEGYVYDYSEQAITIP